MSGSPIWGYLRAGSRGTAQELEQGAGPVAGTDAGAGAGGGPPPATAAATATVTATVATTATATATVAVPAVHTVQTVCRRTVTVRDGPWLCTLCSLEGSHFRGSLLAGESRTAQELWQGAGSGAGNRRGSRSGGGALAACDCGRNCSCDGDCCYVCDCRAALPLVGVFLRLFQSRCSAYALGTAGVLVLGGGGPPPSRCRSHCMGPLGAFQYVCRFFS